MLNDVIFNNDKSAYYDWNLVLTKVERPLPTAKTSLIEIKGSDGVLDLSEVLTGEIKYDNRTVKLTFETLKDADFTTVVTNIANYLHGEKITLRIMDDDKWYFVGRAVINDWECIKRKGKVVITIDCEPYKYAVNETQVTVKAISTSTTFRLKNSRKRVCPIIIAENGGYLIVERFDKNGNPSLHRYRYEAGEHQISDLMLDNGGNLATITGDGIVTFKYREGAL